MSDGARCHYCRKMPCQCAYVEDAKPAVDELADLRNQISALTAENQIQREQLEMWTDRERSNDTFGVAVRQFDLGHTRGYECREPEVQQLRAALKAAVEVIDFIARQQEYGAAEALAVDRFREQHADALNGNTKV